MPTPKTTKTRPSQKQAKVTAEPAPKREINYQLREDAVAWILSAIGAVVLWAIIAKAVTAFYHPDVEMLKTSGKKLFIEEHLVNPEPVEALIFRLSVVVLVPAIVLMYALIRKSTLAKNIALGIGFQVLTWGCAGLLAALTYAGLAAVNLYGPLGGHSAQNRRDIVSPTNFAFYFDSMFVGNYLWVYLLFILPIIALLFFIGFRKYKLDENKRFSFVFNAVCLLMVTFSVVSIVAMNTINFPYTDENKYDFAAVHYAMTQVYAGSPMMVNYFTDTYGMYPHFLLPIFKVIGLTVTNFSLVMSLLLGFCFLMNLWLMRKLVKNNVLLFFGFFTVVYFPYLNFKLLTIFDCLFSLYPIRYIIPSVISCMALVYFTKRYSWLYYVTWLVAGMFVLWNPEIGMVCYMAWAAANIYADFFNSEGKINWKTLALHAAMTCLVLPVAMQSYKGLVYLVYGKHADMDLLFATITYFGKFGVGLLEMTVLHPWNLTALTLLAGYLYAGIAWYQKRVTMHTTLVFLLCIISTGYFTYFQGRSQNSNFALSSGFPLIVLTILADRMWQAIKQHHEAGLGAIFVIALACLSFSPMEIIYNARGIADLNDQEQAKDAQADAQKRVEENRAFLKKTATPNEKVVMLTLKKHEGLIFDNTKIASAFNPGYIDMFQKEDLVRLEQIVTDSSYKVYIEPTARIYYYMAHTVAAVAANYEHVSNNHYMVLLQKRKTKIPTQTFFTAPDTILHRKYTDDRAGIKARVLDADSVKRHDFKGPFSVSALFYTSSQFMQFPTVIGNIHDSAGFIISGTMQPFSYVFGVNNFGLTVTLPANKWAYMVMNVTMDKIDVYYNGKLVSANAMPAPIRNSIKPITIGNRPDFHNFMGAIAEVAVMNHVADSVEINRTWDKIRPYVEPATQP